MQWTHSWQCRNGESASTSRAPMTTSEPARSPETWTVAQRSSAWTHEALPESFSLSSSCSSFQSSFLSLITSDFHVIKLNFVLFGKSSFWERVFRVALSAGIGGREPPYPPSRQRWVGEAYGFSSIWWPWKQLASQAAMSTLGLHRPWAQASHLTQSHPVIYVFVTSQDFGLNEGC